MRLPPLKLQIRCNFSGNRPTSIATAEEVEIVDVRAELLPADKVKAIVEFVAITATSP